MNVRVLSIRLRSWSQGEYGDWNEFPFLFTTPDDGLPLTEPERKFWHGMGPTYQTLNMSVNKIEVDYGVIDRDDFDRFAEIRINDAKKFPPVRLSLTDDVPRSPGWIAPNGDFYPCAAWAHNSLAHHISLVLWGTETTRLEKKGWIAVRRDTLGLPKGNDITERQRTTLYRVWTSKTKLGSGYPEETLTDSNALKRYVHLLCNITEHPTTPLVGN